MIIVRENGCVYIAESCFDATNYGQMEFGLKTENMPICRIPGTRALVAATGERWKPDLDRLRYRHLPFPKELSAHGLHKILPTVEEAIDGIGGLQNGAIKSELVFAKGGGGFILTGGKTLKEIESLETLGWKSTEYRYAMTLFSELPVVDRLWAAYKLVQQFSGTKLFPILLWDTKTMIPTILEEDEA